MPETRYAKANGLHIAYQVFGVATDFDLLYLGDTRSHLEALWEQPAYARFLRSLGTIARVVLLDKRGTGLSDPSPSGEVPSLEQWVDDVLLVLDEVESDQAALIGHVGGGSTAMMFAATHPSRVRALVLLNTSARFARADDYPVGVPDDLRDAAVDFVAANWGTGLTLGATSGSVEVDESIRSWRGRYERLAASPGTAAAIERQMYTFDVRPFLGTIQAPTLVIHRRDLDFIRVGHGRYLAEHIPGARYVELEGDDSFFFVGADELFSEIQEWLTGSRYSPEPDRVLATVLLTDIVGSTSIAAQLGDARWREKLDRYFTIVRRQLERFNGREVKTLGDGLLATFDGPARAVRCADAIRDTVRALGLDTRTGIHTGEIELVDHDIAGLAVHIASRVVDHAGRGEIVTTSTVRDLVAGSRIEFEDRGRHELRGVPGYWQLQTVLHA